MAQNSDNERIILDDNWQSSNPGGVKINKLRWVRFYPKWSLGLMLTFLVFLVLSLSVHWLFWIPTVINMLAIVFYWQYIEERFLHGDTRPGKILSLNPPLFACSTNLSKFGGNYPAIKVIQKPIPKTSMRVPQVGMKLAAVTMYFEKDEQEPFWADIDPIPVEFATNDPKIIDNKIKNLATEDWEELEFCIKQLPQNVKPGLYKFPLEDDSEF
jgi:Protein of unknown function (DUF3239)